MSEEQQEPQRDNKYLKFVEAIQENALNFNRDNGGSYELTYQQGLSIHLRSLQLTREGTLHPNQLSKRALAHQIDRCYKQKSSNVNRN